MAEEFYNTVLLPPLELAGAAINLATTLSAKSVGYRLGREGGLPHITLCQSKITQSEQILEMLAALNKIPRPDITIEFKGFYPADPYGEFAYCGLECRIPNPDLRRLHETVLSVHQALHIPHRGKVGENYWPHMTLLRYKLDETIAEPELPNIFKQAHKGWTLAFGKGDDLGQLLDITRRFDPPATKWDINQAPQP